MSKKHTYEFVKKEFESIGYILLEEKYINSKTPMKYICPKHPGIIQMKNFDNFYNKKTKCQFCSNVEKYDYEYIKQKFKELDYELLEDIYVGNKVKMKYKCNKHPDKELFINFSKLMSGQRCPYCSNRNLKDINEIKQLFTEKGYELLEDQYVNNRFKMKYKCNQHPDKDLFISYNKFSNGQGCPYCNSIKYKNINRIDDIVKEINDRNYIYKNHLINKSRLFLILDCKDHGAFKISYSSFKKGCGCSICNKSKGEERIIEFLKNNNIKYEYQKSFKDCIYIKFLKFDFYLHNYNICIEYDGEQHFTPVDVFGGENTLKKNKIRDEIKNKYCIDNNIKLIRIPYWEFDNIENILLQTLCLINILFLRLIYLEYKLYSLFVKLSIS